MDEMTTDVSALQWLLHDKEKINVLRKERSRQQWEADNDVCEQDRSRKREGFAPLQLVSELKQLMRLISNLVGDLATMLDHEQIDDHSLFYKELLKLYDFLEEYAEDWIEECGPMPMFPVYACLMIDKLMCGFVGAASTFANDSAIRERSLNAFHLEPYRKVASNHNKTFKAIKDCADNNPKWDTYPIFIQAMYRPAKKQQVEPGVAQPTAPPHIPVQQTTHITGGGAGANGDANGGTNGYAHVDPNNGGANGGANGYNNRNGNGQNNRGGNRRRTSGGSGLNKGPVDPKSKSYFHLFGGDMSFSALSPQEHGKYCGDFSTVRLSCPGGCGKEHSWYDCFGRDEKLDHEAHVEQNKAKVCFNK